MSSISKMIVEFKNTPFWNKIHNDEIQVDEMIRYVSSIEFINNGHIIVANIIDILIEKYSIPKEYLNKKVFTSIFLIHKFPKYLLSTELSHIEQVLFNKATDIYDYISQDINGKEFGKKLVTFKILFDDWKDKDLTSQLDVLCEMYYRYQDNINEFIKDESKEEYVLELKQFTNKIETSMEFLTPTYKEYLDNYKFKNIDYDEKVYKTVYKKLKSIYWRNISNQIFVKENYKVIDTIIDDWSEIYTISNINSNINIEIIEEYRGIYTLEAIIALGKDIISFNKLLDSEIYDEIYEYILEKIGDNPKYIIDLFKITFDRLEFINKLRENIIHSTNI